MGVSTDGIICYGVITGEDHPLDLSAGTRDDIPLMSDCDHDEEVWWREYRGYKPPFEMFTSAGNWIGGEPWPQEKRDEYHAHRRAWERANPMPFEMVNACSDNVPEWIICLPGSVTVANRGYAVEISEATISLVHKDVALERYLAFLEEIGVDGKPHWYLGSYWG